MGSLFGIHCTILIDGQPVEPIRVQWALAGEAGYVAQYRPQVAAAAPAVNIDLTANPVEFYPWTDAAPQAIVVEAQAPDGEWVPGGGTLTLKANTYRFGEGREGGIELQPLQGGNTLIALGHDPRLAPGIALAFDVPGAIYPGYFGAIQLVASVRVFHTQVRDYYLCNTQGEYVLDAAAADTDYLYSKIEVEEGEIARYTFSDTPNQELLPAIEGNVVESFDVRETFQTYIVYNGSTAADPNDDIAQIWFPTTAAISWGWTATATNDGQNHWRLTNGQVIDPTPGNFALPSWAGTIRDATTYPNLSLRTDKVGLSRAT